MSNLSLFPLFDLQFWARALLSSVLLMSYVPAESANQKTKNQTKKTLKSAKKDFEVELKSLISKINSIRTKAEYIEVMSAGVDAKERKQIRKRLQKMTVLPRAYYKGKNSFALVRGKTRLLVKMVSFKESSFTINGQSWRFNPKESLTSQLDALALKLGKMKTSASTISLLVPEARALAPLYAAGLVIVNVAARARTAYQGYRVWQVSRKTRALKNATDAAIKAGAVIGGGSSGGARKGKVPKNTPEENRAKIKKAQYDEYEEDYRQKRLREKVVEKELDSGFAKFARRTGFFAGGAAIALSSQLSFTAVRAARENEISVGRELGCTFLALTPFECQKMQVQIEKIDKPETPTDSGNINLPCPSKLIPEYVTIREIEAKDSDGKVVFQGKKIQIIKWLDGGDYVVQEHTAIPSSMTEELGPSVAANQTNPPNKGNFVNPSPSAVNGNFKFLIDRPSLGTLEESDDARKKPVFVIDTAKSKQYEFSKNGSLKTIRKLAFKKPQLIMESESTTAPFISSIVPNYKVPDSNQESYFAKRTEWFNRERILSKEANPAISDEQEKEKSPATREAWLHAVTQMDQLKEAYNNRCTKPQNETIDETIETGVNDVAH